MAPVPSFHGGNPPDPPGSLRSGLHMAASEVEPLQSDAQSDAKRRKLSAGSPPKTIRTTRQPYFRWLGPTAIAPPKEGTFRLLSVNLRSKEISNDPVGSDERTNGHKFVVVEHRNANNEVEQEASDALSPLPELSADNPILPLPPKQLYKHFSEYMSNYLPYMPFDMLEDRMGEGVVGQCLLYAMAALSERLTHANLVTRGQNKSAPQPVEQVLPSLAERYAETAKRLVIPHLACPSTEIVFALLLIAYSEFADDRDSGLWAWSGMAIRMCYDLGLHKANSDTHTLSGSESSFGRNVFWSVVCLDRIISCGTGRMTTIPDSHIEHGPESRIIGESDNRRTDPFPYLCRLLILLGNVSNYINTYTSRHNSRVQLKHHTASALSPESQNLAEAFAQFQQELGDFYTTLPADLLFDVQNFQEYSKLRHSQVFLLLHIWNQALVLAVHHPSLVYPKCQLDVAALASNPHMEFTLTGAISIADMVTFADLIEPKSFLANPFLSQPIYMAACAALTLWHSVRGPSLSQTIHTLRKTQDTCRQTLDRMQRIWRGISWHAKTLDSLAASEADVDLSVDSKVYINTRDLGVVKKASVDEEARQWLGDERLHGNSDDDIYGILIAGMIDGYEESLS
jgi:hypothetical protein